MKKLISLVLTLTLILTLGVLPASAESFGREGTSTSATVELVKSHGDPTCEWSIPAKFVLSLSGDIFSGSGYVELSNWRAEVNQVWKVTADDTIKVKSNIFSTNEIEVSVSIDSDLKSGIGYNDTTAMGQVELTATPSGSSFAGNEYAHLAGTETFTGNLQFTLSYGDK